MSNPYYSVSGVPGTGSQANSAPIRSEFTNIQTGFDKLPPLTANRAVIVNSGATGLDVTAGTLTLGGNFATTGTNSTTFAQIADVTITLPSVSGTLATLAGTETLTGKTISGASNTITNVSLTTGVTGVLPVANGGTNNLLPTANGGTGLSNGDVLLAAIEYVIDGAGQTITTGLKGYLEVPFPCTINRATLLADQSGSVVVDVWKSSYSQFDAGSTHPVAGDKITSSTPPTISATTKSQDSTLTAWTTSISAGDILAFSVTSVTTCQRVTLSLKVTKT